VARAIFIANQSINRKPFVSSLILFSLSSASTSSSIKVFSVEFLCRLAVISRKQVKQARRL
jgi:hypothetical protein